MKLLLIINDDLYREALKSHIAGSGNWENVLEAKRFSDGILIEETIKIDLIISDFHANENILETISLWRKHLKRVPTIALLRYNGEHLIINLTKSGINGILLQKETNSNELRVAFQDILNGRKYFSETVKEIIENNLDLMDKTYFNFSKRDLELVHFLSKGLTGKEIAKISSLSPFTIETYRKSLLKKTQTQSTSQLISFSYQNGLIQ